MGLHIKGHATDKRAGDDVESLHVALTLLATDRRLQGICLWGERSPLTDAYVDAFVKHASPKQPVRLPAYATPADVSLDVNVDREVQSPSPRSDAFRSQLFSPRTPLLERARGGVLIIESAELVSPATAAALRRSLARLSDSERPLLIMRSSLHPSEWDVLANECAFWVQDDRPYADGVRAGMALSSAPGVNETEASPIDTKRIRAAMHRLRHIDRDGAWLRDLLTSIPVFPHNSHNVDRFAAAAATAVAALDGASTIGHGHAAHALRLVVAPRLLDGDLRHDETTDERETGNAGNSDTERRQSTKTQQQATQSQVEPGGESRDRSDSPAPRYAHPRKTDTREAAPQEDPRTVVVPPDALFDALSISMTSRSPHVPRRRTAPPSSAPSGPVSGPVKQFQRGRPLAVAATLHAALPWQRLRGADPAGNTLHLLPRDLRGRRRKPRPKTLYILAVDGSGSMVQGRMHMAKSAALAVLAGAYRERRYVSLIDFRGAEATLLSPPGRSSAAIRQLITAMPSGGGTPLPAALRLADDVARRWLRQNGDGTVQIVLFTDGKANVPLPSKSRGDDEKTADASSRRAMAREDIRHLASGLKSLGVHVRLVHNSGWRTPHELTDVAELLDGTIVSLGRHVPGRETMRSARTPYSAFVRR